MHCVNPHVNPILAFGDELRDLVEFLEIAATKGVAEYVRSFNNFKKELPVLYENVKAKEPELLEKARLSDKVMNSITSFIERLINNKIWN